MAVRDLVLEILKDSQNQEGFISGEELAERCKVTRASIWKSVENLRSRGIKIEAVTNKGYRLLEDNSFDAASILRNVTDSEIKVYFYETIDSTLNEAKRLLANGNVKAFHKNVIVAAEQTSGRGRLGRAFVSPQKSGIYISLIYSSRPVTNPAIYTSSAAVGVCRALSKLFGVDAKIKWVNDIFVNGRKVCGILTEGVTNFETGTIEAAVIGIGINIVNNPLLPQNVAGGIYESLNEKTEEKLQRSKLVAAVAEEIYSILDCGESGIRKSIQEYIDRSLLIGKQVVVSPIIGQTENNYLCTVKGITENAELLVTLSDGTEKILQCGEVSIHSEKMCYNE